MSRQRTILVLGVLLVSIGLLGIALSTGFPRSISSLCPGCVRSDSGGVGVTSPTASGMDAMFIEQMIPHHEDAIAMAELALERSEHPELRQLAEGIVRTQTAENEQMRAWYSEWFDVPVPEGTRGDGMMGGGMMGGQVSLESLRDAEPFDKAFIEQMVPHHRMAVMMSQMVTGSSRPEMRELGGSIIESQSREIDQMLAWYEEWYGR